MRKRMLRLAFLLFLSWNSFAAEITYQGVRPDGGSAAILMMGPIVKGDYEKLISADNEITSGLAPYLIISSTGGDVHEAMKIGDLIEKRNFAVMIPEPAVCFSSCVLVLAAGDFKLVDGKVGIHRPYFLSAPLNTDGISGSIRNILSAVRSYLDKNSISPALADDMFSIAPENIRILSKDELNMYRLNQRNMVKNEADDLAAAQALGISRQEYLRRKKQLDTECTRYKFQLDQMRSCIDRVMYLKR